MSNKYWPNDFVHKTIEGWRYEDETGVFSEETYDDMFEAVHALIDYADTLNNERT